VGLFVTVSISLLVLNLVLEDLLEKASFTWLSLLLV
jgi:hypothetical protein